MNALGIRVEPKKVTFVVIDYSDNEADIKNVETIKIPVSLDFPAKLKYVRNTVLDIIREYSIIVAGIRIAENNSQNIDVNRLHIEGVIQEAFSSSSVTSYFTGRVQSISKKLDISTTEYKELLKANSHYPKINCWSYCTNKESKEAALVGYGALI
ncbi:hypothetical protein J599_2544 [Acinetobacter baumannii 1598530]|uniref:hypothetical protein n=1 Tax=Acinetobacter calcoaceticus/baumannii complex TaxID=909768 RepID=UPI0004612EFE|nr:MULTISPECIES: hypothetical protein [Acinetobacter calcoaceticus/baumannii complex]KCY10457.1 hypothetical protein J599_2544 [Acinetobacter baumannii 1598530]TPV22912.1 hypothetical protein FJV20_12770 [Acinetobacter baumannii]